MADRIASATVQPPWSTRSPGPGSAGQPDPASPALTDSPATPAPDPPDTGGRTSGRSAAR